MLNMVVRKETARLLKVKGRSKIKSAVRRHFQSPEPFKSTRLPLK
jgi:hypothetical protein